MLLIGTTLGATYTGTVGAGPTGAEYASVSSPVTADVLVVHNGATVDHVFLTAGQTHTWWPGNPLLINAKSGDAVSITITGLGATLRLEWGNRLVLA